MKRRHLYAWGAGALLMIALIGGGIASVVAQEGGGDPPVAEHSIARIWDEQLLDAIRTDIPKPPVHARNLFHLSVAMWDAWAAYDPVATGYLYTQKAVAPPLPNPGAAYALEIEMPAGGPGMAGISEELADPPEDNGYGWSDENGDDDEDGDDGDDEDGDGGGDDGDDENGDTDEGDDDEGPDPVEVNVYDPAIEAARAEAISFAAYRVLNYRFPTGTTCHPGAAAAHAAFDAQMDALGYDRTFTSTEGGSPAAVGNAIAQVVIAHGQNDGSNEGPSLCYPDNTGYLPSNMPLIFKLPGNPNMAETSHWQPLSFDFLVLQNGIIIGAATQAFVGVGWGDVIPFGLTAADIPDQAPDLGCWTVFGVPQPYFDPGCPAQFGDMELKEAMLELIRFSSFMDPADGVLIDISPGQLGNNSLGADDGDGHPVNPITHQPYAANVVKRADWVRVVAQSWSDGPQSETPPGHWNVVANEVVADSPALVRRIGGVGPIVNALEWDVKVYLALNGSVHDAAIGSWSTKNYYDSARPISLIRYMSGLGQSSEPSGPSYHPDGLLLEPGLVEVVTDSTVAPGGRHEHLKAFCAGGGPATNVGLPCDDLDADHDDEDCPDDGPFDGFCQTSVGKIAIRAWLGPPIDAVNTTAGVGWRLAETWMPWFPRTFVTPPFPGYTSGHSTFSRSGAEVMAAITGTPYFPGGLGTFDAPANQYIAVEDGPTATVQLQWGTYYDAADEAGISRRFGGIHPFYDDFPARIMGSQIGQKAYAHALTFFGPQDAGGPGGGGSTPGLPVEGTQVGSGNSAVAPESGNGQTPNSTTGATTTDGAAEGEQRAKPARAKASRRSNDRQSGR